MGSNPRKITLTDEQREVAARWLYAFKFPGGRFEQLTPTRQEDFRERVDDLMLAISSAAPAPRRATPADLVLQTESTSDE